MPTESNHNPLVERAKELGAVEQTEIDKAFANTPTVKEGLGDGKVHFFPNLEKIEWKELIGKTFIIQRAQIVENWDSTFGTSDFPLLKILLEDGHAVTTLGSGVAILKQVRRMLQNKLLPRKAKLMQKPGGSGDYYNLE